MIEIEQFRPLCIDQCSFQGYSSEYLTEDSQVLLAGTMEKMVNLLEDLVSNGLDREDVPAQDLMMVIANLIRYKCFLHCSTHHACNIYHLIVQ